MNYKVMDGNEACAHISYMFTEIAGIYPITPSSPMSEYIEKWSNLGVKNLYGNTVKLTEMQSETGAIGVVHGALQTGSLASTYTSSQGLLLMIPSMYKIAGEMLPCVINVATRTVATHALSIFGDHSDIYATRSTGFAFLSSSSVQDVMYMTLISYLSSIKSRIPFVNFFDGFRTSHELSKINVLEKKDIKDLVPFKDIDSFRNNSLLAKKNIKGTNQNEDIYFQNLEVRNKYYDILPDVVNKYMEKINLKFNTDYKPFNYYGDPKATKIIVAMGSICETIKETVDILNKQGEKVGVVIVHLFRPFSEKYLFDVIPKTVKKIAVLDRAKEATDVGEPLYMDILCATSRENKKIEVIGGRYGISSKNTTISDINAVFKNLDGDMINSFVIGIKDDVTNKSLKSIPIKSNEKDIEMIIYGYGSDGMVSTSKDIIKLVGDNTNGYVQGYSRYDSKKSGGLTISYLRIGKEPIRLSYYVSEPHIVVCTKEDYLKKYDVINKIRKNGIFILVTSKKDEELNDFIPSDVKYILSKNNIKFYTIDAYKLAKLNNIENKISMIMEAAIINITKVLPYDVAKNLIEEKIKNNFSKKGEEIVKNNIEAVNMVIENITNIEIPKEWENIIFEERKYKGITEKISHNVGETLTIKDMVSHKDGSFSNFTSLEDETVKSDYVPIWKSENCIQCNKCSIVCPHGVIVPKILTEEEVKNNKDVIKVDLLGKEEYKYALEINLDKCTGCGVCANTCLGKRGSKALEMVRRELVTRVNEKIGANYKDLFDDNTIKGFGFKESLFKYPSACAGCGETPYLKLLTMINHDGLIIANATGCSSIYGGSIESNPYNISWSNSLFEDNAEYGLGFRKTINIYQEKIEEIIRNNEDILSSKNKELLHKWLENKNNYKITKEVCDNLDYSSLPELEKIKEYIPTKNVWIVGGDGWSYDIGFSGLDHIMASNENVNILVLDTEVYSNTGGQSSKSTERGAVAKFNSSGKNTSKKDLARMMMSYKNVYVAHISLGANITQTIKAIKEAQNHNGPSLVIAYAPCINHGIKAGMQNMIEEEKLAVQSGYFPLFRYNGKLTLDYKEPDFDLYDMFLEGENRYTTLKNTNPDGYRELLDENKQDAIDRFKYYKDLDMN